MKARAPSPHLVLKASDIMENFQRLSRFLALPACAVLGFVACSTEEGPGGNVAGSGGSNTPAAGTTSGAPIIAGSSPGGSGVTGGQTSVSGSPSGGAGAAAGGQSLGGTASGGSAAGSGGSSGGSGGGATAMGCTGFTGKFCDDFEGQAAGQAPKGAFSVSGPVTVDTSKAYSGTKSLKITKPSPTGQLRFTEQFPFNDLHGRAMFWVDNVPASGGPHWDLVVAVADNGVNWEIGGMYGKFLLIIDPPDTGVDSNPFPTKKWFCLQWQYKYAGAGQDNTFVAKMDGVALMNGMFTGSDAEGHEWNAGPWDNLSVGFTSYGSNVDTDLWVDDIAFGEQEIACPPVK
jgi:hypothetical protein